MRKDVINDTSSKIDDVLCQLTEENEMSFNEIIESLDRLRAKYTAIRDEAREII